MKIEVKSNTKRTRYVDRYGMPGMRVTPVVEVWIDGVVCYHECNTQDEARALVIRFAYALGLER
jgi:hypothetical protein